jgi:two-component system LytT family response regulator
MSDTPPTLRAMIVDDEVHGREVVRHMLKNHKDVTVIGEAANGTTALEDIRLLKPDLLFLDIHMPRPGGMEIVDALGRDVPPVVVFITAHEKHAVEAFARRAFDYPLKPFDQERFDQTMVRVRERFRARQDADIGRRVREVLDPAGLPVEEARDESGPGNPTGGPLTRFVIKEAGRVFFVPVGAADWLEASGNYVGLHVGEKTHLIHDTLTNVEQTLDPRKFLRIHRSTIVNIDRIKELQPFGNSEFVVVLSDGTHLKLSRSFRDRANEMLGLG